MVMGSGKYESTCNHRHPYTKSPLRTNRFQLCGKNIAKHIATPLQKYNSCLKKLDLSTNPCSVLSIEGVSPNSPSSIPFFY